MLIHVPYRKHVTHILNSAKRRFVEKHFMP